MRSRDPRFSLSWRKALIRLLSGPGVPRLFQVRGRLGKALSPNRHRPRRRTERSPAWSTEARLTKRRAGRSLGKSAPLRARPQTPVEGEPRGTWSHILIILGIILIVVGLIAKISILTTIGVILLIIGAVLTLLGAIGKPVGGRRSYY